MSVNPTNLAPGRDDSPSVPPSADLSALASGPQAADADVPPGRTATAAAAAEWEAAGDGRRALIGRIAHVDKLLTAERPRAADARARRGRAFVARRNRWRPPHAFAMVVPAVLVVAAVAGGLAWSLSDRPAVRRVADYRLGTQYDAHPIAAAVRTNAPAQTVLATRGGGVHVFEPGTHFWRQYTSASTGGRLLTDDVRRVQADAAGNLYFLCARGADADGRPEAFGLCRATPDLSQWTTVIGMDRFDDLTGPKPARVTAVGEAAVGEAGGRLWVATDRAGIGEYDLATHAWVGFYRFQGGSDPSPGPPSNTIYDVAVSPSRAGGGAGSGGGPAVWFATAAGLVRVADGQWTTFGTPQGLAGPDVRAAAWSGGRLWYRTAGYGFGVLDPSRPGAPAARTVVSEGRWKADNAVIVAAATGDETGAAAGGGLWLVNADGETARYDTAQRRWQAGPRLPQGVRIDRLVAAPAAGPGGAAAGPETAWAATSAGCSG